MIGQKLRYGRLLCKGHFFRASVSTYVTREEMSAKKRVELGAMIWQKAKVWHLRARRVEQRPETNYPLVNRAAPSWKSRNLCDEVLKSLQLRISSESSGKQS